MGGGQGGQAPHREAVLQEAVEVGVVEILGRRQDKEFVGHFGGGQGGLGQAAEIGVLYGRGQPKQIGPHFRLGPGGGLEVVAPVHFGRGQGPGLADDQLRRAAVAFQVATDPDRRAFGQDFRQLFGIVPDLGRQASGPVAQLQVQIGPAPVGPGRGPAEHQAVGLTLPAGSQVPEKNFLAGPGHYGPPLRYQD